MEAIITTSYDPSVDFCIEDAFLPDDDGEGSLRYAIMCAQPGDTITLSSALGGDTICLTSNSLSIDKNLVIQANPNDQIYIKGVGVDKIFHISSGIEVRLEGLNIVCSGSPSSTCVRNEGDLVLKDVNVFTNDGGGGSNSNIENEGQLIIEGNTNIKK